MANQLKMAFIDTLLRLHAQGWSQRRIARELGIDRSAVARHLRRAEAATESPDDSNLIQTIPAESKPASAPSGAVEIAPSQNQPARPPARARTPRDRRRGRAA